MRVNTGIFHVPEKGSHLFKKDPKKKIINIIIISYHIHTDAETANNITTFNQGPIKRNLDQVQEPIWDLRS